MNVKEIVKKYLRENFFDGLYCPGECACEISDLFPCGEGAAMDCEAGYRGPCDCGDHDFHIGPKSLKPGGAMRFLKKMVCFFVGHKWTYSYCLRCGKIWYGKLWRILEKD